MPSSRFLSPLVLFIFALVTGCSGRGSVPGGGGGGGTTAPFSLTFTDTPPANVTVLFAQLTLTGATLNPSTGNPVSLLSPINTMIPIELTRLQTESAFISTVSVPSGTYTSITLTFANPKLTAKNDTGSTLARCPGVPPNNVCQISPVPAGGGITFSAQPFPITVFSNNPTGLRVDINLNNLITSTLGVDFTVASPLTVSSLPLAGQPAGQFQTIEGLLGTVANKDATNNQFTLMTVNGNFLVKVDSNTEFDSFSSCPVVNFTCVQNLQVVAVDLALLSSGTFLAKRIALEDSMADDELEGIIYSVSFPPGPSQFQMVVVDESRTVSGVSVGNPVTVTLLPGTSFVVDTQGLTVPASLLTQFQGATDTSQLIPGQRVQVRVVGSVVPGSPITVTTNRVRLRMSRFTATVASTMPLFNFNVNNLPSLFTFANPQITQIQVQTQQKTTFDGGISSVNDLASGNIVSQRSLLFTASPNPVAIADKVRKR